MPIKFLLLGGVLGFFRTGGWKCQFYFYGRGDFSENSHSHPQLHRCDRGALSFGPLGFRIPQRPLRLVGGGFTPVASFNERTVMNPSSIGRCPSTVLRMALGRAFIQEDRETVLGTNPNRTHDL